MEDSFVKIEDKKMPIDEFKNIDLDTVDNINNGGYINLLFLSGILLTSFMWILLLFFRK